MDHGAQRVGDAARQRRAIICTVHMYGLASGSPTPTPPSNSSRSLGNFDWRPSRPPPSTGSLTVYYIYIILYYIQNGIQVSATVQFIYLKNLLNFLYQVAGTIYNIYIHSDFLIHHMTVYLKSFNFFFHRILK